MDEKNEKEQGTVEDGVETQTETREETATETSSAGTRRPTENSLSMGVETDRYDMLPEVDRNPETEAELEGKEGIEVSYSFRGDDIREGLKTFQKATIYKRNLIFTLLLLAMFTIYMSNLVKDPGNMLSTILAVICVAVTVMIWYMPLKHIKVTAEAADANDMQFQMTLYDNCVRIAEEDNGSFVIHYGKEVSKTFETAHLFMICVGKERIFMLPKRYLDNEQMAQIRSFLKEGMGDKHFDKRGK